MAHVMEPIDVDHDLEPPREAGPHNRSGEFSKRFAIFYTATSKVTAANI
jgi:hypothetical protein